MKKEPLYDGGDCAGNHQRFRLTVDAGCILTDEIHYVYSVEVAADEIDSWKEVKFFSLSH